MKYSKDVGGAWLDAKTITDGTKVKIVAETVRRDSSFKDKEGNAKTENVTKVQVTGEKEPVNMRLNWTTIGGLISAYGEESSDWMGNTLSVKKVRALVGDTMRDIIYLIPDGYELGENEESKLEIRAV